MSGIDFQPHPFASFGKRSHFAMTRDVTAAEGNRIFAPERPVLPGTVVPLQHYGLGEVRRVEIDVGKQLVAAADFERLGRPDEEMLARGGCFTFGSFAAAEDGALLL